MNKKGLDNNIYFMIILLLMFIMAIGYIIYQSYAIYDHDCLVEIGKEVCKENDKIFKDVLRDTTQKIICKENIRNSEGIQYDFLEEELEGCKK